MSQCLHTDDLEQLLAGTAAEESAAEFRRHLSFCAQCRKRLDDLSDDAELRAELASLLAAERGVQRVHEGCDGQPYPAQELLKFGHASGGVGRGGSGAQLRRRAVHTPLASVRPSRGR